ncbi:MAG: NrsF family protein, partial [Burkholderiales bacterium]
MKTDELIAMLASGADAVETGALQRRYVTALGWGAFGATLLMAIMLGVRPDLAEAARLPMFWVKLAFPAAL